MADPDLRQLLGALDRVTGQQTDDEGICVGIESERAALRLVCLRRRLGRSARHSTYLQALDRAVSPARSCPR